MAKSSKYVSKYTIYFEYICTNYRKNSEFQILISLGNILYSTSNYFLALIFS